MNIVIVGGGLVGSTLAARLSGEHDVSLIEANKVRARELAQTLDVQVVQGNGALAPVLRDAGVEDASLVVAVTDSDEKNFIVGLLAALLFHVPHLVVRLRDDAHTEGFRLISAEHPVEQVCVNPEAAAVNRIASLLEVPGALDVVSFMDGELLLAAFGIGADSDFADQPVSFMDLAFAGTPTLVAAIDRRGQWIIPHGKEELRVGDLVYFAIPRSQLDNVLALVGVRDEKRRHIMVAGAGHIGLELARRLERRATKVILIEEDSVLARQAADELSHAMVVNGPVTDQNLLREEEVEQVSTFVAVTPSHETNLVACLLAKRLGAHRTFALVDNPALVNLLGEVGIDAIISPRSLAVGLTLQHIRGARVRSVASLLEGGVEVVEAEATRGSRLTSGPLASVGLPRGVLVAAVRRGERLLLPRGGDTVEPGDRVLLIGTAELASRFSDFLTP